MRGFIFIALSLFCQLATAATLVGSARLQETSQGVEVVFPLSTPSQHTSFTLENPSRLVVDLPAARLAEATRQLSVAGGPVRSVRAGVRNGTDLRLVLDLAGSTRYQTRLQPAANGHELVVTVFRPGAAPVAAVPAPRTYTRVEKRTREITVVIDPGHGGKDPGAIGPGGTREKDVVLAVSRKLRDLIDAEPGMRAVLTRDKDVFLPLRDRISLARKAGGDLFISIHADAVERGEASGSSVYVLSTKGASSEAARLLAQRENAADLVGGVNIAHRDKEIASVLLDISQDATLAASIVLADNVLSELKRVGNIHKRNTERAGFVVLKSPDVPSILIETAFISNPAEERKLKSADHQTKLAQAIYQGVSGYFRNRPGEREETILVEVEAPVPVPTPAPAPVAAQPVPTTSVAAVGSTPVIIRGSAPISGGPQITSGSAPPQLISRSMNVGGVPMPQRRVHVIERGESLADVARRYRISVSLLRSANGLDPNQLRMPAGTSLHIPVVDS